jgi:hypothetical protein
MRSPFARLLVPCVLVALVPAAIDHRDGADPQANRAPQAHAPNAHAQPVDFSRDVLPILAGKCFTCHGADKSAGKGGVRLHTRELATQPARSKALPIKSGDPDGSEVVRRIFADDETERMPPSSKKALTSVEKELIRRWIAEGADYQRHWAFIAPKRPKVPVALEPSWIKNEIDAFVLARLENAGIKPSPPADREMLIRRLSLDLRGLPPTLAEVDAFLADRATDAYDRLVDQMLASPHYGEKMAQLWLDLARFGDTSGYNQDSTRQMWLWRDEVVDAFNRNQPFDQFTIEQLAGDLLPNATTAQQIASGFHRNTRFNEEDGADPDEFYCRSDADRTNTLGQVWLGLTLGCCECHDHKYDPISQKEYYQLFAFFGGIKEPPAGFLHDQPLPPLLRLPSPAQAAALEKDRAEVADIERSITGELKRISYTDPLAGDPARAGKEPERYRQSQLAWELKVEGDRTLPVEVRAALAVDVGKRSDAQKQVLRDYYLRKVYTGTRDVFAELEDDLAQLKARVRRVEAEIPQAMVAEELTEPRPAFVLLRGDFQQKGEKVSRAVPAALPPLPPAAPKNRLGLAQWLVSRAHPLTARVAVNRLWAQLFGTGLVKTLGDFGSQGEYPSHPELLDWLAVEFQQSGWDVKALLKTIALSNTYKQGSAFRSEKSDPDNRLLYRAPRFRLSAEEVRDSALAISGLLARKVGGPPIMPYQPSGFYAGKFEMWIWQASAGDEQYRRGLYTFWRRSALHPMFAIFDAPTREECSVSRPRTNTPLQALVTLNDPTFVEAARVFAQHILTDGPEDTDARLMFAFRTTLARRPDSAELQVLHRRYQQQLVQYQADHAAALKLVSVGQAPRLANLDVAEHAAWTALTSMLLNLDEVVMRE